METKQLKIEKGLPIPAPKRFVKSSKWGELLDKMDTGDSVLLATMGQVSAIRMRAKSLGRKLAVRKEGEGMRVWLVS